MDHKSSLKPVLALCCCFALANTVCSQSSPAASSWEIGKIAIQADEIWMDKPPLESAKQVGGSGSIIQKRVADYIAVADSPVAQQRRIAVGLEPSLSPDGSEVVYCGFNKSGDPDRQLIKVNTRAGDQTDLTHLRITACDPAWSPDGTRIAFDTQSSKGGVIAVLDLATLNFSAISPGARPQWSPDGKMLVFLRWPDIAGGPDSVWVVNADGSGLKRVAETRGHLPSASWGADGASIIFTREDRNRSAIFRVNLDGSRLEKIAGDKNTDMYFPLISPDGKQLAVIIDSDTAPILNLIDLDTHKSRAISKALRASIIWAGKH